MPRIVIYGAGGFGREVLRHVRNFMLSRPELDLPVFASDNPDEAGSTLLGLEVIGPSEFRADDLCVLAVGNGFARRRMAARCPGFVNLIAPTAIVYPGIAFREGSIVCDFAVFSADQKTVIGRHFHCNMKSHVAHDCVVGEFVTHGPSVSVNGNVHIGDDVYVGSGAQIRNGTPEKPLRIGQGAVVGIGAVVTRDVPPGVTVVGNPARPIESRRGLPGEGDLEPRAG
jgi:sugar O-acyltransferase (sialic acid O-acetyltransferase NeuD family)